MIQDAERRIAALCESLERVREEVAKIIVGNRDILDALLTCLLADGHALLEGIPGLGKTRLVSTLASALQLDFSRVQFTPDLMPADIVGTNIVQEEESGRRSLVFQRGPVFAHLLLADEINRATPKTQSALLEAMQEKTVSVGRVTHRLELPFFVLATQNPLEMEGTYALPEAQLDRFLMKLKMEYPDREELHEIIERTTQDEPPDIVPVLDRERILELRGTVRSLPVAREIRDYAIRLILATHPTRAQAPDSIKRYVRFGSSPRGAQALILAGKVRALSNDRAHVASEDVAAFVHAALRHRLLLNFEGEASGVDPDTLLDDVLAATPPP
jgi:MoxR-like ATPase